MKLMSCTLMGFGKLYRRAYTFSDGINVIYGENESGKTTLRTFLTGMLFGLERKRGIASKKDEFHKYQPCNGGIYGGTLSVSTGDQVYQIQRNFTDVSDITVYNEKTGKKILSGTELTGKLFSMTREAYLQTLCISQGEIRTDQSLGKMLNHYLTNMSQTKSREVNVDRAVSYLRKEMRKLKRDPILKELEDIRNQISRQHDRKEELRQFQDQREIHYIGGADILPAPLNVDEETAAIRQLGTEYDETARKRLIEHNLRLVVYIAKKFDNTGVGVEDLISIGTIGLIKAINTFNPQKNIKLATYASRCIENEILMYLRRNSKTKMEVSIDEPLNVDWDGNELLLSDILGTEEDTIYRDLETEAERKVLFKAINRLSGRERAIIRMRFGIGSPDGEEKTQKEVADMLGISQSYISRLEKKIMQRLRKEMVKYS